MFEHEAIQILPLQFAKGPHYVVAMVDVDEVNVSGREDKD